MKVLIVNTSECTGGAAVAASRLCDALNDNGVKTKMLVRDKQTSDITVVPCGGGRLKQKWCFYWERIVIWLNNRMSRQHLFQVSIANAGIDITHSPAFQEADIIHLHWVNQGLLSLGGLRKILQSGKPVVWTMHDMWPLTSICHHAYDCEAYATGCAHCRFLRHPGKNDLAARVFRRKRKMLEAINLQTSTFNHQTLHFVAVSEWLAEKARKSALIGHFPIHVIPNVLAVRQFTIVDRTDARTALDISRRYVIAIGAARLDDPIKGFSYLKEALRLLVSHGRLRADDVHLLLFGTVRDATILHDLPVHYTHLGYIDDKYRLSEVYSAANIVVSSSLYETFGQTLIEAMACGCLPVSFDGSGQTDIIAHEKNGYLARRLSAESLADGMEWALKKSESEGITLRKELRRSVVRRYGESIVANQYLNLYQSVLSKHD